MVGHVSRTLRMRALASALTLAVVAFGLLLGLAPIKAEAGICNTTVQIGFSDLAGLGTASFIGTPDTSFVACSTAASATADLGPFGPGGDMFTVSVSALDDDTFAVTATATDGSDQEVGNAPEFWQVAAHTISLSGITWNNGPGAISSISYNPVAPFALTPILADIDNFSFRITPTVVDSCGGQGCSSGLLNIATIDITANHIDTSVPVPTTLGLLALGLAGIGYRRYRSA